MAKKGVIFDLDGTLTLTQQFHEQAFAAVFQPFGISYGADDDFYYAGAGSAKTFPGVFAKHGVADFDLEGCLAKKKKVYQELLATRPITPVSGVQVFLQQLRAEKIPFIVASGNRKEFVQEILQKADLGDFFSDIVTNHDVAHGKPAPDIFLESARRIGVAPEDCVVFEDAWSGIQAAKAAGMYCVGLATGATPEHLRKAGADLVIHNFTELSYETLFR